LDTESLIDKAATDVDAIPLLRSLSGIYRLECVPSQSGVLFVCLHPQKNTLPVFSAVYFTGEKPEPLWLPSQKG
jgi:hypothetical protein